MSFVKGLKLSGNHLTRFPDLKGISKSIQLLDLSDNRIRDISPIAQSGIEDILQLDLSYNRIVSIPDDFKKVKIFVYLSFSNNQIKKIPAGVLKASSSLLQLFLQNNEIEVIEKGSFDGMTSLIGM
ncbi:leucine-rich repeat and death domain-containing protein 1-like [Exaiptasia diaphana]|uniref:Uncharacterized protein n=1 Tax=Exaiptasia diaphana TaxID=2652724 RepID=A0A913X782_EXADI|nr:leucine-rich repeat and death domain-containing protein 1-like [Exaiptasia diaphana]